MVLCKIISFRSLGEKLKFVMKSPSLVTNQVVYSCVWTTVSKILLTIILAVSQLLETACKHHYFAQWVLWPRLKVGSSLHCRVYSQKSDSNRFARKTLSPPDFLFLKIN